jgi:hypothetical protein
VFPTHRGQLSHVRDHCSEIPSVVKLPSDGCQPPLLPRPREISLS